MPTQVQVVVPVAYPESDSDIANLKTEGDWHVARRDETVSALWCKQRPPSHAVFVIKQHLQDSGEAGAGVATFRLRRPDLPSPIYVRVAWKQARQAVVPVDEFWMAVLPDESTAVDLPAWLGAIGEVA